MSTLSHPCSPPPLHLAYSSRLSARPTSAPLLRLDVDNSDHLFVSTNHSQLQILHAHDGRHHALFSLRRAKLYASPLPYDCDADGQDDILIFGSDGSLHCFNPRGPRDIETNSFWRIKLPNLQVHAPIKDTARGDGHFIADRFVFVENGSSPLEVAPDSDIHLLDPHVTSSGTLADVDNDGNLELVVAVKFISTKSGMLENLDERSERKGVNIVAIGLICIDLEQRSFRWKSPINLMSEWKWPISYQLTSPAVVDLDGDGNLEVGLTLPTDSVQIMNAQDGSLRKGWPIRLPGQQTHFALADLNDDGSLEVVVTDLDGNLHAFREDGHSLWHTSIHGSGRQSVAFGNWGNETQVVVTTVSGWIHIINGRTGKEVDPSPIRINGQILAPALVMSLEARIGSRVTEPHLVVSSIDGKLYTINALDSCIQTVDIGEYTDVDILSDDVTGDGRMDLLLATSDGNLMRFETSTPYMSRRGWRSAKQGRNVGQQREGWVSVEIVGKKGKHGAPRFVLGGTFDIEIRIRDSRRLSLPTYHVEIHMGRIGPLLHLNLTSPGTFRLQVPCPRLVNRGILTVSMLTGHAQYFEDTMIVSVNEGLAFWIRCLSLICIFLTTVAVYISTVWLEKKIEDMKTCVRWESLLLGAGRRAD